MYRSPMKRTNLFEKKYLAIESVNEKRRHFFDSTMFFGEYPITITLKKIIDIESYQEFEYTPFSHDKNYIYLYEQPQMDINVLLLKEQILKPFTPLEYRWAKDDFNVFYKSKIVEGTDVGTFQVNINDTDSASDQNSMYVRGRIIKN